jgi:hypothetical protein
MLVFNLSENKVLTLASGTVFPGEVGVAGVVDIPAQLDGESLDGYEGNAYIMYGTSGSEEYAEIALEGVGGVQGFAIPSEAVAAAGTVTFWFEFTKTESDVLTSSLITGECEVVIPTHAVYSEGD